MDGGDGKRGWLCHGQSQKGASPNKEELKVGRRDIQGDTEITVGRDHMLPIGTLFGFIRGRDSEVSNEDLIYESRIGIVKWVAEREGGV